MSRFLNLSAPAILLASAFGSDGLLTSAGEGTRACQVAVLRNGFSIQHLRREVAGAAHLAPPALASLPETAASGNLLEGPFQNVIASAASRYQIDPDFVASVVKAESNFDSTAVSPKGAQGLMQLMPETAARLGVENALDPAANVGAGTKYLRQLLDQFDGDAVKALAAYNAGPQRVEQYGGIPPYRKTRDYVTRIIDDFNRKKLQQQAHSPVAAADE
jgi:soluble lytic murein transglycosylase-like protein